MSSPSIFEANLAALLGRAYAPVRPSAAFRARLAIVLGDRIADHVADRHAGGARPAPSVRFLRAAAALLVVGVLASIAWYSFGRERPTAVDVDAIAHEHGAVRIDDGAWRPLLMDEIAAGLDMQGRALEVATSASAPVRIRFGSRGRLDAAIASRVRVVARPFDSDAAPARDVRAVGSSDASNDPNDPNQIGAPLEIALERGGFDLERYDTGADWSIATSGGRLQLDHGAIAIACAPSERSATRVRALLVWGLGSVETAAGPVALEIGRESFLDEGGLVAALDRGARAPGNPPGNFGVPGERSSAALATTVAPGTPSTAPTSVEGSAAEPADAVPAARVVLHGQLALPGRAALPPGSTVTLLREVRLPTVIDPQAHPLTAASDEFTILDVAPGTYSVFVEASGYATWQRTGLVLTAPEVHLEVALEAGVALRGRVVDAHSRAPVEGALVVSESDFPVQVLPFFFDFDATPSGAACALSGPDGRFELAHASRGVHVLRATRRGLAAGWSDTIDLGSGSAKGEVEIALPPGGSISGLVADAEGEPAIGAVVIAARIERTTPRPRSSYSVTLTDVEGRFAIDDLCAGCYVVFRRLPDAPDSDADLSYREVCVDAGRTVEVDLSARRRGTEVAGTIRSHAGRVIAEQDVTLWQDGGPPGSARWRSERTRPDGGFRFADVKPGHYEVYVGHSAGTHFVIAGEIEVPAVPRVEQSFTLGPCAVRGRVSDATDASALGKSAVMLEVARDAGWKFIGKTQADAQGEFAFEGLSAGNFRVTGHAARRRFAPVSVEAWLTVAQPERRLEIALGRGASLTVHVTGAAGEPVEDVHVRLISTAGESISYSSDDLTDERGTLAFGGVQPGRFEVRAEHASGRASLVIDLVADEERTLELVLEPSAPK